MVVLGETEIFTLSHLFTILMSCCWVLETIVIILGFGNLSLDIEFGNLSLDIEFGNLSLDIEYGNLCFDVGFWKP